MSDSTASRNDFHWSTGPLVIQSEVEEWTSADKVDKLRTPVDGHRDVATHPNYPRYAYRLSPGWLFGRQVVSIKHIAGRICLESVVGWLPKSLMFVGQQ